MNSMAKNAGDFEMILAVGDDGRRWNRYPTRGQVVRAIGSKVADMEDGMNLPSGRQLQLIGHRRNHLADTQRVRKPGAELARRTTGEVQVLEVQTDQLSD